MEFISIDFDSDVDEFYFHVGYEVRFAQILKLKDT